MKNLLYVLLAAIIITGNGCSKEEETITPEVPEFNALVNTVHWQAVTYQISIYQETISIRGTAADGSIITINLSGDSTGVYTLDENSASSASFAYNSSPGSAFSSGGSGDSGGIVSISEISLSDKKITGSFEFTGVRSSDMEEITVTGGLMINLPYSTTPIGTEFNSMSMKLGGNKWTPTDVNGFVAFQTIFLSGVDADGVRNISFEFPEQIGPGTYNLNYFTNYKAVFTNSAGLKHYAVTGSLEIISHNLVARQIVADFSVKTEEHEGTGKINITEGKFDIIYE